MPFFPAVETYPRIRQKSTRASKLRKAPEIFCRSFIIRRSRSERLLSNGTEKSRMKAVGGQQPVVAQIYGRALDAGTILHGGCGFRRERGAVEAAAGAGFDFSLVLGDLQLRLGQIEELPALDAVRSLFREGTSAARAALDRVTHCAIR